MTENGLSRFVPLPDIAPVLQRATTERSAFRRAALGICAVTNVEAFPPRTDFDDETSNLLSRGDASFDSGYFREALLSYTEVLQRRPNGGPALRATCFAKRSATFAMMSCELCVRSADACALYGMDASRLAHLSLKDAENVKQMFPNHGEGFLRSAFGHYLAEKYAQAREDCLEGLRWNFASQPLKACLELVDEILPVTPPEETKAPRPCSVESGEVDEFECKLCLKLLYEPVTTPCGHSFCRPCMQRSLDHSNKCPMCRTVMHVSRTLPVNVTLKNITFRLFRTEYLARKAEMNANLGGEIDEQTCFLPLFVLFTLFPGEKMSLNVFEPRYRLMIRRVMEGNRRFGMIQSCCQSVNGIYSSGTECEIVECELLADGRYFLEVVGRRRFDVMDVWEQDGYRMVRAQYFRDQPVQAGSEEMQSIHESMLHIEKLQKTFKARGLLRRQSGLKWDISERSNAQDMEDMSFLACALLINPDGSSARRKFLDCRSTLQRIEWILQGVRHRS